MKTLLITLAVCLLAGRGMAQGCSLDDTLMNPRQVHRWKGTLSDSFPKITYPEARFNLKKLKELYYQDTNTYVRIYFTLPQATFPSNPGALMVPFSKSDCYTDKSTVLLSDYAGGKMGKWTNEMKAELKNWRAVYDSLSPSVYDIVYGYNFIWDSVFVACADSSQDLKVVFGLSALDADSSGKLAFHMYLTSINGKGPGSGRQFVDFALPCPKLCGNSVMKEEED